MLGTGFRAPRLGGRLTSHAFAARSPWQTKSTGYAFGRDASGRTTPRSEGADRPRASGEEWAGSVLVSGEPPTPARLEALEREMRAQQATASPDAGTSAGASRYRIVRFWAPGPR